jgi:hypothetical protein
VPEGRRDQRHQRGREQDQRDGQVHEGDEGEDERRRQGGDGELRQVLAEVDLELLDAFHHREDDVAGAGAGEVGGAQRNDALVDGPAERLLHARGGAVRGHGAPVVEAAADRDGGCRQRHEPQQ